MRRTLVLVTAIGFLLLLAGPAWAATAADWEMDETTGTSMADSSVNANHGTISNVVIGAEGFNGVGTGYQFIKAQLSHVDVPSSTSLNPGSADVTITVHIKSSSTNIGTGDNDWDLVRKGSLYKAEIFPFNGVAQGNCKFKEHSLRAACTEDRC